MAENSYSQNTRLSLKLNNTTIKDAFREIEKKSEYVFIYRDGNLDTKTRVSIDVDNQTIDKILDNLLASSENSYKVSGKQVYIIRKEIESTKEIFQSAQTTRIVTGIVKDITGEPLVGVSVVVKGTTIGMVTNIEGAYSISVADNNSTLVFSYMGFKSQEIKIGERNSIIVVLEENSQLLDEVVVVGYGVQKKVNLTGSIASIDSKSIDSRPISNVSSSLSGLASGVYVRQASGRPGDDGATIRVRGTGTLNNSDALVIIDGIEGSLDDVNPNDVENISILKDAASASIYGSRAANGVILVTTKKGLKEKVQIDFSVNLSNSKPVNMPEFITDYVTLMKLFNESNVNIGRSNYYSQATIDAWEQANKNPNGVTDFGVPNYIAYPNTDWGKAIFNNAWAQNYNLGIRGGNQNTQYNLSAGYFDNPGIMDNTGMKKYQLRINLESTYAKFLTFGTNTFMSTQSNEKGDTGSGFFDYLRQKNPGIYPYMYNGYYGAATASQEPGTSSSLLEQLNSREGKDHISRLNTTVYGRVNILEGLTFESKVNYQIRLREQNTRTKTFTRVNFATMDIVSAATQPKDLSSSYSNEKNYQITLDNVLRYNTTINKDHNIGALIGHNEYYFNYYSLTASKKGMIDEDIYVLDKVGETENKAGGTEYDRAMRSFFGRFNYDYKSKYLFEFNLRRDGSSRFGPDNRWGTFPGVSLGWRISEESFLEPLRETFSSLKLRASWGRLGNDAAGDYDYQALYSSYGYTIGGITVLGLGQSKMSNLALKWETTESTDLAIEGLALSNRLSFELGYYNKDSYDVLAAPPIPMVAGNITGPTVNDSEVNNKGLEITLGWSDKIGDLQYSIKGNFAYNVNKVSKYKGKYKAGYDDSNKWASNIGEVSNNASAVNMIVEGRMINEYYLRQVYRGTGTYFHADGTVDVNGGPRDGMIRTSKDKEWFDAMQAAGNKFSPSNTWGLTQVNYGDLIYADLNGDGVYGDSFDREFTNKSSTPKYTYGFNINLAWKQFDLSMVWAGAAKLYHYVYGEGYNSSITRPGNNISKMVADDHYYYNPNDPNDPANNVDGRYPRLTYMTTLNTTPTTDWLYAADFLKLKNLQIGYTIPANISKKAKINRARIYLSGENLLTITPYPFLDPEMGGTIGYPLMRQLSFGVNVSF